MTSSSDLSVAQVQSALLETIEKVPELRASLAAIAERIHEHPANAEKTPIQDWQEWLDDEGYDTAGLHQFIGTLLDSGLISNSIRGVKADDSAGELISLMQRENPNLLDSILHSIDHSLQIHEELFGLAGGTARQPITKALSIGQKKKEMATREAAAESAMSMSREASPLTDTTSVMGRDGAGEQKQYSRALDGVRTEVKASEDARAEFRHTDPGMMGATDNREFRERQPVDGLGGVGEERGYARAMDERNEVVDRRDIEFTVGEEVARESVDRALAATVDRTVDRLTKEVSDLSAKIPDNVQRELSAHMQQISAAFKDGAFRPEVERAEFSIAERSMADLFSASRELEKVLPKAEHDRLMRQVDYLKDVVGVALKVGETEKREPREFQPMDGRGGAGEEREYARAIDAMRESLERRDTMVGPGGEQDRLSRVVDDLRQAIDRRRTIVGPGGEQDRLSRAVDAVREALDRRDTMVGPGGEQDERLDRAVDALRDALTPNRGDARAEFRETDPGMMGATEKREPREVQPMDGRGGAGEERGYARAMDERRDMVRDERLDMVKGIGFDDARETVDRALKATVDLSVDRLTNEISDLSAKIPDNVQRELSAHMQQISTAFKDGAFRPEVERAELSIAERSMADLFSASRELEKILPKAEHDRLMRQVDSLQDVVGVALKVGATEKREPREVQPMDGLGGAGEERGYARAMDERRDMVRDERLDMVKGIGFDDARETVDRALKATVDLTVDRLTNEISDLSAKIPDNVQRELSAHMQQISRAFKDGAFRPEVERAEFSIAERSMADLFSASRELEKVLPKAEHDRLMRQVDSLKDVVGVALKVGATEKREPREFQPMDGRGGAGEEREYARAIDAMRESLERRDTMVGPGGEQDRLSRVVDDLRQAIDRRRTIVGPGGEQDRLSRAVDAVREALDRRDTMVGPGGEQDERLDRAVDALRDALTPNRGDARAEFRETDPGMMGATEKREPREVQPMDGRGGAGEERGYARAMDERRDMVRDERLDMVKGIGFDDARETVDRALKATVDLTVDRLTNEISDLSAKIPDNVQRELSAHMQQISTAFKEKEGASRPEVERAEFSIAERSMADLFSASRELEKVLPKAEHDRLMRQVDALQDVVGVALNVGATEKREPREVQPMDGRGGAGEEREYARAIDAVRELLERRDTILGPDGEQDRLSRVVDDLRQAIESRRDNLISEQGRLSRAVDAVREALDRRDTMVGPGGEQDERLDRAVDALRDALTPSRGDARAEFRETDPGMMGATEKREPREVQSMDGRGGAGEERGYARAMDERRDMVRDERFDMVKGITFDDARETVDRALKATVDLTVDRLTNEISDLGSKIPDSVRRELSAHMQQISTAFKDGAFRPEVERAEFSIAERSMADLFSASRELEKVLPKAEHDRLMRQVDSLKDVVGVALKVGATEKREPREVQPMDGRGGAGEERGYARAMDERRDMVRDERFDMVKGITFDDARETVDRALKATVDLTVDRLTNEISDLGSKIPDSVRRELSAHMQQISTAFKMGAFRPEVERAEFSIAERSMADLFSASRELEKVLPKAEHDRLMRQVDSLKDVVGVALKVGATEKREPREVQPMDGLGGAGEERGYARAMDERRDMVRDERFDMVKGITFDDARETVDRALKATVDLTVDRLTNEISDLGSKIPDSVRRELSAHMQQISTAFKMGAFRPEVERAEFSIAERSMADLFSASRELEKVLPKAEHDRLMRQVDSLKDVVGVALKVGATEKREPREVQSMDGRGGAGEERGYARAMDERRDMVRDERLDMVKGITFDDARETVDRALKATVDLTVDRLTNEISDLSAKIPDNVQRKLSAHMQQISTAFKEKEGASRPEVERAEFSIAERSMADLFSASRELEKVLPKAEHDRLMQQIDALQDVVGVALKVGAAETLDPHEVEPIYGRGGAGEEREYARAIDAMRESLERRDTMVGPGGEQDRLSRVVDDLRQAIDRRRTIVGPGGEQDRLSRAVDAVREALDRRDTMVGPGGEQDERLDRAVDALRDALTPNRGDARAEFRETDPGMMGATEDQR